MAKIETGMDAYQKQAHALIRGWFGAGLLNDLAVDQTVDRLAAALAAAHAAGERDGAQQALRWAAREASSYPVNELNERVVAAWNENKRLRLNDLLPLVSERILRADLDEILRLGE